MADDMSAAPRSPASGDLGLQRPGPQGPAIAGPGPQGPAAAPGAPPSGAKRGALRRRLFEERLTISEVAQAESLIPSYVTRLVRLTFLAPDITASILSGRHDPDLTVSRLMADTRFPLDWSDQRRSFASA